MKNILFIVLLSFSTVSFSQLLIDKSTATNTSVALEFGTQQKAIIIPVTDASTTAAGSLYVNATNSSLVIRDNSASTTLAGFNTALTSDTSTDITTNGVIIGATSSSKQGALVFEGVSRAPVLPNVSQPEISIRTPEVGMLVYDPSVSQIKIFLNGQWNAL